MEAIIRADDGTWYGFYHNERTAVPCGSTTLVTPRIGVARSSDLGVSWTDLGIVIEATPSTFDCATFNKYLEPGGTDKEAGRVAWFFLHGRSNYVIHFDP